MSLEQPTDDSKSSFGLVRIWNEGQGLGTTTRFETAKHYLALAWRGVQVSPVASALTSFTIILTLTILSLFVLIIVNVQGVIGSTQVSLGLTAFLRSNASAVDELVTEIKRMPEVEGVNEVSATQALEDFRKAVPDQQYLLEGIDSSNNPLPASIQIKLKKDGSSEETFDRVAQRLKDDKRVEHVEYSRGLLQELGELLRLIRAGGLVVIGLLLALSGFLIAATIQLSLYARREEIEIMTLLGATGAFVRVPYLIEGAVHGLLGAILGLSATYFSLSFAQGFVSDSNILQLVFPDLQFLSIFGVLLIVVVGVGVGALSSFVAVKFFEHG